MILIDTSVWIDHLRTEDRHLRLLLDSGRILVHPWVIGELILGNLRDRAAVLEELASMPQAPVVDPDELLAFIVDAGMSGLGIGLVDAQLLASARHVPGTHIWTRDRRLAAAAARLDVVHIEPLLPR